MRSIDFVCPLRYTTPALLIGRFTLNVKRVKTAPAHNFPCLGDAMKDQQSAQATHVNPIAERQFNEEVYMPSTLKSSLKVSLVSLILIFSLTEVSQAHKHPESYSHDGGRKT